MLYITLSVYRLSKGGVPIEKCECKATTTPHVVILTVADKHVKKEENFLNIFSWRKKGKLLHI